MWNFWTICGAFMISTNCINTSTFSWLKWTVGIIRCMFLRYRVWFGGIFVINRRRFLWYHIWLSWIIVTINCISGGVTHITHIIHVPFGFQVSHTGVRHICACGARQCVHDRSQWSWRRCSLSLNLSLDKKLCCGGDWAWCVYDRHTLYIQR